MPDDSFKEFVLDQLSALPDDMIIKALVIWMLIAVAEVLHGVLLVSLMNRRVGDHSARQISRHNFGEK